MEREEVNKMENEIEEIEENEEEIKEDGKRKEEKIQNEEIAEKKIQKEKIEGKEIHKEEIKEDNELEIEEIEGKNDIQKEKIEEKEIQKEEMEEDNELEIEEIEGKNDIQKEKIEEKEIQKEEMKEDNEIEMEEIEEQNEIQNEEIEERDDIQKEKKERGEIQKEEIRDENKIEKEGIKNEEIKKKENEIEDEENKKNLSQMMDKIQILQQKSIDVHFNESKEEVNKEIYFFTGSKYIGKCNSIGMSGFGRFIMPHGVIFEGEFKDYVFHGQGSLEWPQKQRIDGVWHHGELQEKQYTFSDGLVFQENDWNYCQFPDRRFFQSIKNGLNQNTPTVKTYKSQKAIGILKKENSNYIEKNYLNDLKNDVDCQLNLNENCLNQSSSNIPYILPFSKKSPQSWWRRLNTFERDVEVKTGNEKPVPRGEDISYKLICGEKMMSKNSNLSETICVPSIERKTSIVKNTRRHDESVLSLKGKFQGYYSSLDEIFDDEMREITMRTRVVHHDSSSSRTSLNNNNNNKEKNKLDLHENDEKINITVEKEAEKEHQLMKIMTTKTKEQEILKDLSTSKQEMFKKDKETSSKQEQHDILRFQ